MFPHTIGSEHRLDHVVDCLQIELTRQHSKTWKKEKKESKKLFTYREKTKTAFADSTIIKGYLVKSVYNGAWDKNKKENQRMAITIISNLIKSTTSLDLKREGSIYYQKKRKEVISTQSCACKLFTFWHRGSVNTHTRSRRLLIPSLWEKHKKKRAICFTCVNQQQPLCSFIGLLFKAYICLFYIWVLSTCKLVCLL